MAATRKSVSIATGNRRLLKLADLLEADAKNRKGIEFYFFNWGTVSDPDKPLSCGTQACAMGLAALSGAFKKAGLTHKFGVYGELDIQFRGRGAALGAAMRVFAISSREASRLFAEGSYLTETRGAKAERQVAKHIRKFVVERRAA